jgi:hypothetical protein
VDDTTSMQQLISGGESAHSTLHTAPLVQNTFELEVRGGEEFTAHWYY